MTADLTAEYPELSQPLGDLVGRPGFRALLPLASQGRGTVEREALIQDAARIYLPGVTEALREVLGGFLELPETAAKQVVEPRTTNSELPPVESLEVVETQTDPPKAHSRTHLSLAIDQLLLIVNLGVGTVVVTRWLRPQLPPGVADSFLVSVGVLAVLVGCFVWWLKSR